MAGREMEEEGRMERWKERRAEGEGRQEERLEQGRVGEEWKGM
jgi:hypothetical protein